ncbi:ferrous iron transport protein B [Treponema sp.]|uniref:ferrous iron transport protein B n=1 Tax=Treponema sp. TaxID=166 RepID=UPI003F0054BC
MPEIKIALAGNPNCGKTTMFNSLTGSNQYVGNWPGVTVEKKEGKMKGMKDVVVTDLPGIYSLSPYTSEEVVSRDYLIKDSPDAILDLVDATNIERNLYLTTQLLELGKPTVIALNMIDVLKRTGDVVDTEKLQGELGCPVVETSALKGTGVKEAAAAAKKAAEMKKTFIPAPVFSKEVEGFISRMELIVPADIPSELKRWYAIKILERDSVVLEQLSLSSADAAKAESISQELEKAKDDDIESIITNERYLYIQGIVSRCVRKSGQKMTVSDKIDRVVTNRWLGIPIFLAVMWIVYYIAVSSLGTVLTDWANDGLFGDGWNFLGIEGLAIPGISSSVEEGLSNAGANEILIDCIVNGVIGGVGAVLGFVPQMAVLFFLLTLIEDCGYMVRIAFVMDRIFRKFGLSGKSFIPLLVGSGCGVPGIMASRTIENDNDRRLTIFTTTWVPCGAKLPVIALISGVIGARVSGWDGGSLTLLMYLIGILSVVSAAVILKKTRPFHGKAAPFVMELPQYHIPHFKTVLMHTWERLRGFIVKAGTILFLACLVIWFLSSYGFASPKNEVVEDGVVVEEASEGGFGLVDSDDSLLADVGNVIRHIFKPLGFGNKIGGWQSAAASLSGFSAKEAIVSTMGVLADVSEEDVEDDSIVAEAVSGWFATSLAAFAFLMFNLLDSPCLAAIATMANELKSRKWFWFAICFQNIFAYCMTLIVYQLGMLFVHGQFGIGTVVAFVLLAGFIFALFRKDPYQGKTFDVKKG